MNCFYFFKPLLSVLFFLIIFTSCKLTTTIYSDPKGAKIFIDNVYVGKTPYIHTFTSKEAKNQSIKLVVESPPPKKLSTIEKIKMFEKLSNDGKISKNKFDKYRTKMEKNKSTWQKQKIPHGLKKPSFKNN
tara:strand:- start:136 stop:528 length:393 start_codon:yes stop_codon:yes gene_type:complete